MSTPPDVRDVDMGDGLTLHVARAGSGPPLLLLHGFTGSMTGWNPLARTLESRFTIITVDLPGHGRSTSPADHTRYALLRLADDLSRLLDTLAVGKVGVIGYSLGGRAALQFALHCPHRVAALLLESATPGIEDQRDRAARLDSDMALADMIERDGVESFVQFWEHLPIWASQSSLALDVRHAVRAGRLASDPVGLANSLRAAGAGARPSVVSELHSLTMPTLLIAGSLDPKFVALAHAMGREIPDSRTEIVNGAGHTVHLERPDEFASLAMEFFARCSSADEWAE